VMPFVSFYAQEARSFAIVCALVLAATHCLVVALDRGRGWWVGYAAAVTVAAVTNELAVLVLVAHGVTLWVRRVEWRSWWRWAVCAAVGAAAVAPLVVVSSAQSKQVEWLAAPSLALLGNLAQFFFGPGLVMVVVMAALSLAALVFARRGAGLELVAVAAPLALVPPVVLISASFVDPLFHPRYVLYAAAGIPLLAAVGLDRLITGVFRERLRWLTSALIGCAVLAVGVAQVPQLRFVHTVESRPDDLAAAAAAVRMNAEPGDPVLFMPGLYRLTALGYPEAFVGLDDLAIQEGPAASASLTGRDLDIPQTDAAMLAASRIWVIGRSNLALFPAEAKSQAKQATLATYFRRVRVIPVHGLDVALYEKRAGR
jgi:mannosyltransferase